MKEKYIPKIGDKVRLLVADHNFNEQMEDIVANTPIVTVTSVEEDQSNPGEYNIDFIENQRNPFYPDEKRNWQWTTRCNHFEFVEEGVEDLSYIEPLTQLLKDIKHV